MILRCYDGEARLYNESYERPFKCHLTAAEPEQCMNMQYTHACWVFMLYEDIP